MSSHHRIPLYTCCFVEEIDEGFAEFALVVMDVNGLKQINDNFGHKAGDVLIKSAAMFICHLFRKSPVYRIGGDEFIAILQKDDYNNREELIAEFDEKLENKMIDVGNNVIKLSIARGITVYEKGMTYQEVFNKADEKMYTNKAYIKWNCQEMCSRRIPKILDSQISGSVRSELL